MAEVICHHRRVSMERAQFPESRPSNGSLVALLDSSPVIVSALLTNSRGNSASASSTTTLSPPVGATTVRHPKRKRSSARPCVPFQRTFAAAEWHCRACCSTPLSGHVRDYPRGDRRVRGLDGRAPCHSHARARSFAQFRAVFDDGNPDRDGVFRHHAGRSLALPRPSSTERSVGTASLVLGIGRSAAHLHTAPATEARTEGPGCRPERRARAAGPNWRQG